MLIPRNRITKSYFDLSLQQYLPVINKCAFETGINLTHIEELKVIALKELLMCLICYDKSIGTFMGFLINRLFFAFNHNRDKELRVREIVLMPNTDFFNITILESDTNLIVEECIEFLNNEEEDIITELFFNNKTTRQLASEQNGTHSSLWRKKNLVINKMRQKCGINNE